MRVRVRVLLTFLHGTMRNARSLDLLILSQYHESYMLRELDSCDMSVLGMIGCYKGTNPMFLIAIYFFCAVVAYLASDTSFFVLKRINITIPWVIRSKGGM